MKKIIVILLFVFIFVSCKTKEQIEEDAKQKAQKISKVYAIDVTVSNGYRCPENSERYKIIFKGADSSLVQEQEFCTKKAAQEFVKQIDPYYEF